MLGFRSANDADMRLESMEESAQSLRDATSAPENHAASLRALSKNVGVSGLESDSPGPKQRILIAEDNVINQKVASHLLQRLGYATHVAENGAQAVEALKQAPFDLVLLDIQMPVMDGYEACKAIRASGEAWSSIPIVALTANALPEVRERCLNVGMSDFLTKPVTKEKLAATVSRNLSAARVEAAERLLAQV